MTLFDIFFFILMGYFLYTVYKMGQKQQRLAQAEHMSQQVDAAIDDAIENLPYYYYEIVKASDGNKQYLLYKVKNDEYCGQAKDLTGIKRVARKLHEPHIHVFIKNPKTNKISSF